MSMAGGAHSVNFYNWPRRIGCSLHGSTSEPLHTASTSWQLHVTSRLGLACHPWTIAELCSRVTGAKLCLVESPQQQQQNGGSDFAEQHQTDMDGNCIVVVNAWQASGSGVQYVLVAVTAKDAQGRPTRRRYLACHLLAVCVEATARLAASRGCRWRSTWTTTLVDVLDFDAGSAQQVRMDSSAVTTRQLHANSPIDDQDAFTNSTASKLGSSSATPSEDENVWYQAASASGKPRRKPQSQPHWVVSFQVTVVGSVFE
jgi:hypothetical protein